MSIFLDDIKHFKSFFYNDLNDNNIEYEDYDEDSPISPIKTVEKEKVLREFKREGDSFIAIDHFYHMNNDLSLGDIQNENDLLKFCEEKRLYYKDISVISDNIESTEKEYYDIFIFNDLQFDFHDVKFSKQELILKLSLLDIELDNKLIKDLYCDTYYKFKPYEHINDIHLNINKKYLFLINYNQLFSPISQSFS